MSAARRRLIAAVIAALVAAVSCGDSRASTGRPAGTAAPVQVAMRFPVGARFDYQIGGAYRPAAAVRIVDRDRSARPSPGRYNICYVNAFQAQTADTSWWQRKHPGLLLRDRSGRYVIDRDWNEVLFDIGTAAKRHELLGIVGTWFDGCARQGFQAVEPDNLDSYTRSHGLLSASDAVAFAALLSGRAHRRHLAIGQKNAAQLSPRRAATGFDFAVAEECQVYGECADYTRVYGRAVIEIEYTDNGRSAFAQACRLRGARVSVLLRDRDVVPAGHRGYVSRWCPA